MSTQFCNYTLVGEINRGGSSIIYRAQDQRGNVVALKVLAAHLRDSMEERARFMAEPRTQPRHPNIVKVTDAGECNGVPYIAMELIEGGSLADILHHGHTALGPVTLTLMDSILADVAKALDSTHKKGIIHRDIKPGNILIRSKDQRAYVTDFGIAQVAVAGSNNSSGTSEYMAPEQIQGHDLSAATDVYSLGITVYEALAGRLPFIADGDVVLAHKHIHEAPPDLHTINPRIPPEVSAVVMRALQKEPAQRYASTGALARAFHQAAGQSVPGQSRLPVMAALVGGLVLVTVLIAMAAGGTSNGSARQAPSPTPRVTAPAVVIAEATATPADETATPRPTSTNFPTPRPVGPTATLAPAATTAPVVTATVAPDTKFAVQAGPMGREPWGKPTSPDGCSDFDDQQPVNRYEFPMTITNNGSAPLSGWSIRLFDAQGSLLSKCITLGQEGLSIAEGASYDVKAAAYLTDKSIARIEVSAGGISSKLCVDGQNIARCN